MNGITKFIGCIFFGGWALAGAIFYIIWIGILLAMMVLLTKMRKKHGLNYENKSRIRNLLSVRNAERNSMNDQTLF